MGQVWGIKLTQCIKLLHYRAMLFLAVRLIKLLFVLLRSRCFDIKQPLSFFAKRSDHRNIWLKVPNVEFDFDVSVWHCLLSTHASKLNSTLGSHLHAMIRTHHFDYDIRF